MSIRDIIALEMEKSGGEARLVTVPRELRPTAESLQKMEREISAQISANEVMRSRSMQHAMRKSMM